jgi:hypothetical protein
MRIVKLLVWACVVLVACSVSLQAQTSTSATVLGTVKDTSGGVVGGAQVTLRNVATNATNIQTTNGEGYYTLARVEPGGYTIVVVAAGFQTATISGLNFDVTKSYTVDLTLKVGSPDQTVTVSTEAAIELQTTDATIGNVIDGNDLLNLPTISRGALELLTLQSGAMPSAAQGDRNGESGGSVTGARSDQNAIILDGIDVTDIFNSGQPDSQTIVPMNEDALAEFRVGVTNPNATAASAAGGQVSVATKGGTNAFHGDVYYYIQNTAFNANSWDNNSVGNARPPIRDNRGGFSFGGPIRKDKTFIFMNYEPRRFGTTFGGASNEIVIPSDTLRKGILYLSDTAYNLDPANGPISQTCGPGGNSSCDPRGLGISPLVSAMWNLMPHGNDLGNIDSLGSATHPNLVGYIFNAPAAIREDTASFRLDHNFSQKLHFFGRYGWTRDTNNLSNQQVDLRGSTNGIARLLGDVATRGDGAVAGLDWVIQPTLINSFHFGWLRQRVDNATVNEAGISALLNLPGTKDAAGDFVAVQPGYLGAPNAQNLIGQPIAAPGTNGVSHGKNIQFEDDLNWIKGKHQFTFGGDFRWQPVFLTADVAQGAVSSLRAIPDLVTVSNNDVPGGDASVNSITHFYGTMLGLVNKVDYLESLDASFKPLPGHNLASIETNTHSLYFYFQDTWRVKPSVTLTYGLAYGVQMPYTEKLGRGMVLVDTATNKPIDGRKFLDAKKAAALQGTNYNPTIGYIPYGKLGMPRMWNTDWTDIAPRVSVAWSPSSDSGFFGGLFGQNKTVIRTGYAMVYDRLSGGLISHILGVPGFYQSPTSLTPACNASGAGGVGCNASSSDPAISTFRVGVDGAIPIPALIDPGFSPSATQPFIPDIGQGGVVNDPIDPNFKEGRNHMVDFSIQRELPKNMIMEVGYIGRLGRRLPSRYALNAMPYMYKDVTKLNGTAGSGQSFAQAFDNVAQILRYQAPGTPIPTQAWFEDQLPAGWAASSPLLNGGGCGMAISNTQCFANLEGTNMVVGNLGNFGPPGVFAGIESARCGDPLAGGTGASTLAQFQQCSLINVQQIDLQQLQSKDVSFYHALTATLRNRGWRGLVFDLNYTWSKSLDQGGRTQGFINGSDDPFNPDAMYGPSYFDRKHVFNAIFNYNLPFGQGHKLSGGGSSGVNRIIGGWSFSGVFRASSGLPLVAAESPFAWGGGFVTSNNTDMIRTGHNYTTGLNHNNGLSVAKAGTPCAYFAHAMGGAGQKLDPTVNDIPISSGSGAFGFNYFSDPVAAYCSFRPVLLSSDTSDGRGNPLRGFGTWNLDSSIGKETAVTERFHVRFSADFFNMFNHLTFVDPIGLPLGPTDFMDGQNAGTFGVVSKQFIPANRQSGSRWIQFGLRVSF